jgi:sec-independent protein translocase protein TatB
MLDIGWSEMAIIAVVALFVIGPRELPKVLRTLGRYAGKIKAVAREFQDSIDEAVRESEIGEVKKQIEAAGRTDFKKSIEDTIDPERKIGKAMDFTEITRQKPKPDDATATEDTGSATKPTNGAAPSTPAASGSGTAPDAPKPASATDQEAQAAPVRAGADKPGA